MSDLATANRARSCGILMFPYGRLGADHTILWCLVYAGIPPIVQARGRIYPRQAVYDYLTADLRQVVLN